LFINDIDEQVNLIKAFPVALDFTATTIESSCIQQGSSSSTDEQFTHLLSHLLKCTCYYVTTHKHPTDCPQLIYSFFDLCKRFLIFSSNVLLCNNDILPTLFSFTVACLRECSGDIDSTRSILNFLQQIMSTSDASSNITILEPLVLDNGQTITNFCVNGLFGGNMPQILQPSLADCLVSLFIFIVENANNSSNHSVIPSNNAIENLFHWISTSLKEMNNIDAEYASLFEQVLLNMLKEKGNSNGQLNGNKKKMSDRQSMKMLFMDFSKVCKGEMNHDCLLTYTS